MLITGATTTTRSWLYGRIAKPLMPTKQPPIRGSSGPRLQCQGDGLTFTKSACTTRFDQRSTGPCVRWCARCSTPIGFARGQVLLEKIRVEVDGETDTLG